MKLEITIGNSQLMFLAVFVAALAIVGIAGAYNPSGSGGTPSVMGHSVDELDWSKAISNLYVSGNVGIGTTTPATKLDVNGQVTIRGGSPAAGKVLTSDASGLASWQTPTSGGDITDVNGGNGLTPNTCSSGSCTIDVSTGAAATTGLEIVSDQVRLMDDGCVAGEVLKRNAANNGWVCQPVIQCVDRTNSGPTSISTNVVTSCNSNELILGGGCEVSGCAGGYLTLNTISGGSWVCKGLCPSGRGTVTATANCCALY